MSDLSPSDVTKVAGPLPPVVGRSPLPRWRVLVLARIQNYALMRRHLGRASAENLAADLALRIAALVPESRIGAIGRDLLELAFETNTRGALDDVLTTLAEWFSRPLDIDKEAYAVDLLFGVAVADGPPADEIRMAEQAEHALSQADGERRVVVRDVDAPEAAIDRIALARDLDRAVARGELFLQYQPKMHVRRQAIASIEALVRWRHPTRGLVLPGDFIALAEETRAIVGLTLWTIRQALADQVTIARTGHDLRVFVNISGVVLSDPGFIRDACALIGTRGDKVGFEVTETSVIRDPESAIANLQKLADVGVEIAIDDYGAGLSSLAYLKRLPARELKIDKLFVTHLSSSNRDPLIVRSTIDLAHALDMEVVAEGVETEATLALLSVMGCDMIQGYFLCRPIGLNALISFLDEKRYVDVVAASKMTFNRLAATWKRG